MTETETTDGMMYFPWSQKRGKIFRSLLDEPCEVRSLMERTGLPRTTIRDNLGNMESLGWVETNGHGTYRPTPTGRVAYESFEHYRDNIRVVNRFEPLFEYVDPAALDFDLSLLLEAELIPSSEEEPLAPSARLANLGAEADHMRGFLAVVDPGTLVWHRDRITSGELTYELVADPAVLRRLDEVHNLPIFPDSCENDIQIFDGEFPFSLTLFDGEIVLIHGFDHTEGRTVLVESTNPDLVEWGVDTFESFWQRASPMAQIEELAHI